MSKTYFVTGTDTEVGKTFISSAILHALAKAGKSTIAMKPVAAGCDNNGQNDDALALIDAMTAELPYKMVNPVALNEPIAPHIAAQNEGKRITASRLEGLARGLMMRQEDILLIEGAGGWLCPLNNKENLADLPRRLQIPIILVVGLKLGCLNHALLTAQAIRSMGLTLVAWVANGIDDNMAVQSENIEYLHRALSAPCLGVVPFCEDATKAAAYITVDALIG